MRWPRGKYNGWRIVGFEVRIKLDVLWWCLCLRGGSAPSAHVGPFHIWIETNYDQGGMST